MTKESELKYAISNLVDNLICYKREGESQADLITDLEKQIEKMKCCQNCKYSSYWGNEVHCNYGLKEAVLEDKLVECHDMDKWELKK